MSLSGFLKHDFIMFTIDFCTRNLEKSTYCFRNLKKINLNTLYQESNFLNWSIVRVVCDSNEQIRVFNNFLNRHFDKHMPVETKSVKAKHCPWFSTKIEKLICKRNIA